jgi:hypothetical protein
MNKNVFVVGTGRCGSTLLSNMFRQNENMLSISEFFAFTTDLGTLIHKSFPKGEVSAAYFWEVIGSPHAKQNLMLREGIAIKEVLYEVTEHSEFNLETGVPAIMQTTLPHMSDGADDLYYELKEYVLSLSNNSISDFYSLVFEWLKERMDRNIWIERTGGSLRIVHRLYEMFPDAKFIHIVRDGKSCAMSMEKHYGFKMVMIVYQLMEILGVDPFEDSNRDWEGDLPDDIASLLPENFDVKQFKEYEVSPSLYGHYWSGEIIQGLKEMEGIPEDQKLTIKYEDLLTQPDSAMRKIAAFIGEELTSGPWIENCIKQIRKPNSDVSDLETKQRRLLEDACRPGFEALEKIGVQY